MFSNDVHFPFVCSPICEKCLKRTSESVTTKLNQRLANPLVQSNRNYFQGIGHSGESHAVQGILKLKLASSNHCRHFSSFQRIQRPLRSPGTSDRFYIFGGTITRQIGTSRLLGGVGRFLKIRYLVLTSAVGGGITLNKVKHSLC